MKLRLIAMAGALVCLSANAQDIYQMERASSEDLNGTARFVGMGGAMSALGADISTMSTNPAGIGLFRRADISTSMSVLALSKGESFDNHDKGRMSFDQIGFVYPFKLSDSESLRFFNLGFNYHKRKNLHSLIGTDQIVSNGASQTWEMSDLDSYWIDQSKWNTSDQRGTPLSTEGYETYLYNYAGTKDGSGYDQYNVYNATSNSYRKSTTGGVQEYDFNMSANLQDQYYFGMTIGVYNVDIDSYSEYAETLTGAGDYILSNDHSVTGSGVDFKFGAIIRPVETSSFRFGVAVTTPTYFSLTSHAYSEINSTINGTKYDYHTSIGDHDYNIHTPWKFNVSAGGTVADFLALGAEYEYADFSAAKVAYDDGNDDWDWSNETKDKELNRQASKYLNGVSTLRLGAEAKVADGCFMRLGYNYVSSPIKDKAFLNQFVNSASIDYATSTSYLNLGDINRLTFGLGYRSDHFYADFAYQYQIQSGDFYAFSTQKGSDANKNDISSKNINLDRSQFLFTLGYKF